MGYMVIGKLKRSNLALLTTSRNVQLWTWVSGAPGSQVASGLTDSDGDFNFTNVSNGYYCVKYQRPSTGIWYVADAVSPTPQPFLVNNAPVVVNHKMKVNYEDSVELADGPIWSKYYIYDPADSAFAMANYTKVKKAVRKVLAQLGTRTRAWMWALNGDLLVETIPGTDDDPGDPWQRLQLVIAVENDANVDEHPMKKTYALKEVYIPEKSVERKPSAKKATPKKPAPKKAAPKKAAPKKK